MEKEEIRIEPPTTVARITLVPVVRSSIGSWQGKRRFSFFGLKQPVSVLVVSPQGSRAFRMDGEEIPLDELIREVPGIKDILEGISST